MLSAFDLPGMPHSRRYVGASWTSSNSTLAFSNRLSSYFKDVRELHSAALTQSLTWESVQCPGCSVWLPMPLGAVWGLQLRQEQAEAPDISHKLSGCCQDCRPL